MCHHHITRVMYVLLIAFVTTASLVVGISVSVPKAQATPGMLPFGGHIISNEPLPIPCTITIAGVPCPPCPPHIIILDYSGGVPKTIGITLGGLSTGPTFEFYNLYTPGVAAIGEYVPFPICTPVLYPIPYPVFSATLNPMFGLFQMGTGDAPGF